MAFLFFFVMLTILALAFGAPQQQVYDGLWGYNPVLAAIAIGGMFFRLTPRSAALGAAAAIFSCIVTGAVTSLLRPVGLPALTFPAAITAVIFCVMGEFVTEIKCDLSPTPLNLHLRLISLLHSLAFLTCR